MSDPVTNVEIEDVLSSIRRLVSDGDKARTRDPAPVPVQNAASEISPETASESMPAISDRLVLTPAFLVAEAEEDAAPQTDATVSEAAQDEQSTDPNDDNWVEESWPEPDHDPATAEETDVVSDAVEDKPEPLALTDMVFEPIDDDPAPAETPETQTDRAGLVATIAELEAAISAGDDEFEPDGSEVVAETIAWPGPVARVAETVDDAGVADDAVEATDEAQDTDSPLDVANDDELGVASFEHRPAANSPVPAQEQAAQADDYTDDDLDGLLGVGAAGLDETALRALVADVVREELAGPMGERITRNMRKLVRREIYRILSSQDFD